MFWSASGSSGSVGFSCLWYQSNAFHHKCNQNSQLLIHNSHLKHISLKRHSKKKNGRVYQASNVIQKTWRKMKIMTTNTGCFPTMENFGSSFHTDKRLLRCCSPVRTLLPSLTLPFHPKGTDVRSVPLVVRCGTSQFQQHIAAAWCLPKQPHRSRAIRVSDLHTKILQLFHPQTLRSIFIHYAMLSCGNP